MRKINFIVLFAVCAGLFASAHAQKTVNFRKFVEENLAKTEKIIFENGRQKTVTGVKLAEVCDVDADPVAERVFADYGAIFVGAGDIFFPTKCIFSNEVEVINYQNGARAKSALIGGVFLELQEAAMNALLDAQKEAGRRNLKITPRGLDAAKRSYADTVRIWNSRFYPALNYWTAKGKIARRDAEAARAMPVNAQVAQVLKWEEKKLWFNTNLTKSILYSVAAPGASQHIFMLAFDVEQFASKPVREILAKHGWFQTVKSDLPHFTYLGLERSELPKHGLKSETIDGQEFWIPNLDK